MKQRLTASIVILTNDRPELLRNALLSIAGQTVTPKEVIVVDDSSVLHNETVAVIRKTVTTVPVITRNTEHSISYGRTVGAKLASGDIVIYLDDDCAAEPDYVEKFLRHFTRDPRTAAVFGRIINARPDNLYAATQYAYYDRGLKNYFPSLTRVQPLTWGRILDCEVLAIRNRIIRKVGFAERHRYYRNDDVELGLLLVRRHLHVLFDPGITASATPRVSLRPLIIAAFGNGYSDTITERIHHIRLRDAPHRVPFIGWWMHEVTHSPFPWYVRPYYASLLLLFPIMTRFGKFWSLITHST